MSGNQFYGYSLVHSLGFDITGDIYIFGNYPWNALVLTRTPVAHVDGTVIGCRCQCKLLHVAPLLGGIALLRNYDSDLRVSTVCFCQWCAICLPCISCLPVLTYHYHTYVMLLSYGLLSIQEPHNPVLRYTVLGVYCRDNVVLYGSYSCFSLKKYAVYFILKQVNCSDFCLTTI